MYPRKAYKMSPSGGVHPEGGGWVVGYLSTPILKPTRAQSGHSVRASCGKSDDDVENTGHVGSISDVFSEDFEIMEAITGYDLLWEKFKSLLKETLGDQFLKKRRPKGDFFGIKRRLLYTQNDF